MWTIHKPTSPLSPPKTTDSLRENLSAINPVGISKTKTNKVKIACTKKNSDIVRPITS